MTNATTALVTVEAPASEPGATEIIDGTAVEYVNGWDSRGVSIRYAKYTHDYSALASRPWQVNGTGRRYSTLSAAVRAVIAARAA